LIVVSVLSAGLLAALGVRYYQRLEQHNRDLSAANEQIVQERDEARREWERAERETARAETNLDSATEAVEQMLTHVGLEKTASLPHMDRTRARLLEDAVRFFDRLIAAQAQNRRLRHRQAKTLFRAGQISYLLSKFPEAVIRLESALDLVHELQGEEPPPVPAEELLALEAQVLNQRGLVRRLQGDLPAARADFEEALRIREELAAGRPGTPDHLYELVVGNINLAAIARTERRKDDRLVLLGRARTRAEELMALRPMDFFARDAYAAALNHLGLFQLDYRERDLGQEVLEKALEVRRELANESPGEVHRLAELGEVLTNAGTARRNNGYFRRAAALYAEAMAIREKLTADHPDVARWVVDSANTRFHLGELHREKGEPEPAEEWYTKAIGRVDGRETDPRARAVLRDAHAYRGEARSLLGRHDEAADDLKRAVELADGPDRALFGVRRAIALARFAPPAEAVAAAEAALRSVPPFGELLFDTARAFAVAGKRETDRKMADGFLRRAVELLNQAQKLGYFRTGDGAGQLDKHPDLDSLRGRADFKALRARGR
jgi:tetratricopeptide (TPR) repeat protein